MIDNSYTNDPVEYFNHLVSLGIDQINATSMLRQHNVGEDEDVLKDRYWLAEDASDAILTFAVWEKTEQGVDYWGNLRRTLDDAE